MKYADMNPTQQAQVEGLLANQVLEEIGLDHEGRIDLWQLIMDNSPAGQNAFDQIWIPALEEARKRLAQETEGTPPGPERT